MDWHRTGVYQYIVAGWDAATALYEAWEASGLHTRLFCEEDVRVGMVRAANATVTYSDGGMRDAIAWWADGEVAMAPDIEDTTGQACPRSRDRIFAPRLAGWKPYGTLEMAGPMLFQLAALRRREPTLCRIACDIGAGTGRMAHWLSHAWGFEVTALDIVSPQWPEYKVEVFDGRQLPLADKSVDCALFAFVLHHCRHFEVQRALLREAARVARRWIFVAEDTPEDEGDRRSTRGHDRHGEFHSAAVWRTNFQRLKLRIIHEGPVWEGPKHGPSPYHCTRRYFVLEVPTWLLPRTIVLGPRAAGSCALGGCAARAAGCDNGTCAAGEDGPVLNGVAEGVATDEVPDLRDQWLASGDTCSTHPDELGTTKVDTMARAEITGGPPGLSQVTSFGALRLPSSLKDALRMQKFVTPTPIQCAVIPVALAGIDMVGVAQTGSGKTLAYVLPTLLRLLSAGGPRHPFVLVLAPTRELVIQIAACANALSTRIECGIGDAPQSVGVAGVWGGGSRWEQKWHLRNGAAVVVATPGRLLDLACEEEDGGHVLLATVCLLVLDEGDRMLEDGMADQLDALALRTAPIRQTMFFSATWPEAAGALARRLCRGSPALVRVGSVASHGGCAVHANRNIKQCIEVFDEDETEEEREAQKHARLLQLLDASVGLCPTGSGRGGKAIVFCMTKKCADGLVGQLVQSGVAATAVHGNKAQTERLWNLDQFARGETRVLVATDVLGRGLDIPQVTHVFIYDFPGTMEEYIHRIGRTARGIDGVGHAVAFFEFAPCLPNLASEAAAHLEALGHPVPASLRRIATEVTSGVRGGRAIRPSRAAKVGTALSGEAHETVAAKEGEWFPLARLDELGDWHAGGQRSWLLNENPGQTSSAEATGWFVLCSGGRLQTHVGDGTWQLMNDGRLLVEFGGTRHELELRRRWEGRRYPNFVSVFRMEVSSGASPTMMTGWVSRSKTYRYREPAGE